ncbi:hypothetical protein [Rhodanobacter sp. OR87]|uniref:hypothetical protein n=1 Tax=Rhodanobacter sp. OR87 TaxID=1076523 RepID=UPI001E53D146|nr:hypothetical protein [Rhodanobacter sp. OR87]
MHAAIHLAHKHAKAGADPQLSVWFGQQGTHGAESFIRILPQRIAHMLEMPAIGKHAIEPGIRSHPQIAVRRLRYRPYVIAGQALWIRRIMTPMLETTALPFVTIEPRTEPSHPQLVVVIREQAVHRTLGQRRRVVRVMAESLEINAVIAHQVDADTEPHEALLVLHHGIDRTAGQTIRGLVTPELRRR